MVKESRLRSGSALFTWDFSAGPSARGADEAVAYGLADQIIQSLPKKTG